MEDLLSIIQALVVPVLGWLARVVSQLNTTLSNLDKSVALIEQTQGTATADIRILFEKSDKLENEVARLKERCHVYHKGGTHED